MKRNFTLGISILIAFVSLFSNAFADQNEKRRQYALEYYLDYHGHNWFAENIRKLYTIGLYLGNTTTAPTQKDVEELTAFRDKMKGTRSVIIYDADSLWAAQIRHLFGNQAFGISGKPSTEKRVITIRNSYWRLQAFKKVDFAVATPDSLVGMGVNMESRLRLIVDRTGEWKEYKTGVVPSSMQLKTTNSIAKIYEQLGENFKSPYTGEKPLLSINPQYLFVPYFEKEYTETEGKGKFPGGYIPKESLLNADAQLQMDADKMPGGTVIFGSGKTWGEFKKYTDFVYEFPRLLSTKGIPVATGGSGGYMEIANDGAYSGGSHSIGITLGGGGITLASERTVSNHVQTLTIGAYGFETRIPLLLYRRVFTTIAPGGPGTMQELAVTYIDMAADKSPNYLVFLKNEYYGYYYNWLKTPGMLPEEISKKIVLLDNLEETEAFVTKLQKELSPAMVAQLQTKEAPQPRNDIVKYVEPEPVSSSYSDMDWEGGWFWDKPKKKEEKKSEVKQSNNDVIKVKIEPNKSGGLIDTAVQSIHSLVSFFKKNIVNTKTSPNAEVTQVENNIAIIQRSTDIFGDKEILLMDDVTIDKALFDFVSDVVEEVSHLPASKRAEGVAAFIDRKLNGNNDKKKQKNSSEILKKLKGKDVVLVGSYIEAGLAPRFIRHLLTDYCTSVLDSGDTGVRLLPNIEAYHLTEREVSTVQRALENHQMVKSMKARW